MKLLKSQVATLTGKSHQWISQEVKSQHLVVDDAGRIDTDVPINRAWLFRYGVNALQIEEMANVEQDQGPCVLFRYVPKKYVDMTFREFFGLPSLPKMSDQAWAEYFIKVQRSIRESEALEALPPNWYEASGNLPARHSELTLMKAISAAFHEREEDAEPCRYAPPIQDIKNWWTREHNKICMQ